MKIRIDVTHKEYKALRRCIKYAERCAKDDCRAGLITEQERHVRIETILDVALRSIA